MNKLLTFTRRNTPTLFFAKIIALFFFAVAFTQLSFGQQGCPNLITNGDFTQGVNSFTTSFSPGCITGTDCNKGFYCVNPDFNNKCSSWATGGSLAPSGGNFMIIDGFVSGTAPFDVWRYTPSIPVVAGKSYIFSFWAKSVHPTTGGQAFDLDMAIRPLEASGIKNPPTIFTIPITNVWTKYSRTWLCPPNANGASLFIQQPIGKDFSDFGLDDISFTCACQAAFTATPINNCGLYQITNTSVGTPPISYQWCNGVTTPSLGNVQLNCGKNDYCLTMTAADGCTSTVTQSISFTETTPPVITCPPNKILTCGTENVPGITGIATATDNCTATNDISITYTEVVNGIANCDQTIRRTWTAKDKCGNTSSCIQTISIIDNVKPVLFNCPQNTTVNGTIGANGLCTAFVPLIKPTATDNCSPSVTITHNIPAGNIFPNGTTTVIWTATDDCMNTSTCSTIVTVLCFCPNNLVRNGNFIQGIAPGNLGGPGSATFWNPITTPQVVTTDGFAQNGCMQMWGNQVVGEGIEQAANFQVGCTYVIKFNAKYLPINPNLLNPQIRFRATTAAGQVTYGSYGFNPLNSAIMGNSATLTNIWATYSFPWTVPATPTPLVNLAITVWNNSAAFDPAQTSWVRIDDICITKETCPPAITCGDFTHTGFGYEKGPFKPAICGNSNILTLQCPNIGQRFYFSGAFNCIGGGNPAPITWQLWRNSVNTGISGSTTAIPFFNIPLLSSYFPIGGLYELRLVGHCGDKECPCTIKFEMPPCPDVCPCDNTFKKDVSKGFYQVFQSKYCRRCFTPIALKECDKVEWSITPTDSSFVNPAGITNGNQSFCFTFAKSGTYTITMKVTRLRPDGTTCMATFSKKIKVTCNTPISCDNKVFLNPEFKIEAKAGVLGNGGNSKDWLNAVGKPTMQDTPGGWLISLIGNEDSSDAIRTNAEYCVQKDTGTMMIRAKLGPVPVNKSCMIFVNFVRGDKFTTVSCSGDNCFEVACLQFPEGADNDWFDFEFDYDLRDFSVTDQCNNATKPVVKMRPLIYIGNALHTEQGTGDATFSQVLIQSICMKGDGAVPTKNVNETLVLHIYPNPNSGSFTVELPIIATPKMTLRITDLTGRLILEKLTEIGTQLQNVDTSTLPNGLYFLQVVADGKTIAVEKFVKQ